MNICQGIFFELLILNEISIERKGINSIFIHEISQQKLSGGGFLVYGKNLMSKLKFISKSLSIGGIINSLNTQWEHFYS
jgi:hypothetical protein